MQMSVDSRILLIAVCQSEACNHDMSPLVCAKQGVEAIDNSTKYFSIANDPATVYLKLILNCRCRVNNTNQCYV